MTSSPEGCQCSGSHSHRSPISLIHSEFLPHSVQSLPTSPQRKHSGKQRTVVTSELFSSDEDKSRSLELIYSEPEDDQKQKLSSIYRMASPPAKDNGRLEKRKASFTQVKRVVVERQFSDNELISDCSSGSMSKGSVCAVPLSPDQSSVSPLILSSSSSSVFVRGPKSNVKESGFEEQIPTQEFEDVSMSAVKPDVDSSKKIPEQ